MRSGDRDIPGDADWRAVTGSLKWVALYGAAVSIFVHAIATRYADGGQLGVFRAKAFLSISYITAVPALLFYFRSKLRAHRFPAQPLRKKILMTALGVGLFPAIAACPWLLLWFEPTTNAWRAHAAYFALTSSVLGLALMGAAMIYGAAFALWMLIFGLHGMWTTTGGEE